MKKQEAKKVVNPLSKGLKTSHRIGHPARKRSHSFIQWPSYIRLEWPRAILYKRLKAPPAINQFTRALEQQMATLLLKQRQSGSKS
ncbi:hypothetical protein U0070_004584 [Myodes glareolus]|uniref:60S ribosomal protein L7a n=1 Tax=Myodes glareolus TaxID=447135 RepID=A0AAW0ICS4_MYOGA